MNRQEAQIIASSLATRCAHRWSAERLELFAHDLLECAIGGIPFEVVRDTLSRLAAEVDPDTISLARLVEGVKTRAPPRLKLEGPLEPAGDGPVRRGLRYALQHGGLELPPNPENRAMLANMLGRLAHRMHFRCVNCGEAMSEDDAYSYTARLMDAGRVDGDPPLRLCIACMPRDEESVDAEIPF